MRIVGGKFRGKKLASPRSDAIRPTTDRTRESLFNILNHLVPFEGIRVLDGFAGTGALGLEAISRGADFCLFVDEGAEARGLLRKNIEAMNLQGQAKVFRRDATKMGEPGTMPPFDLILLDPPYGRGLGEKAAGALIAGKWLHDGAHLVLEEKAGCLPATISGLNEIDRRKFGDSEIAIYAYKDVHAST